MKGLLIILSLSIACFASDKAKRLEELEKVSTSELFNTFLESQANLFFDAECAWIVQQSWSLSAKHFLEIGSGNGAYLHRLADRWDDKQFTGVELRPELVHQAAEQYAKRNLVFLEGDAEVFDARLQGRADIVLFRATLQYLNDPISALENAARYLSPNGYIVIMESFDQARRASHPISVIDEAVQSLAEVQENTKKGNRKVALELLQSLEAKQSRLADLFEVVSTNIDSSGKVISHVVSFEGRQSRSLYFNHALLLLAYLSRTYGIRVDLSKAYDELQEYLSDENAWISPGLHFLVLRPTRSLPRETGLEEQCSSATSVLSLRG